MTSHPPIDALEPVRNALTKARKFIGWCTDASSGYSEIIAIDDALAAIQSLPTGKDRNSIARKMRYSRLSDYAVCLYGLLIKEGVCVPAMEPVTDAEIDEQYANLTKETK